MSSYEDAKSLGGDGYTTGGDIVGNTRTFDENDIDGVEDRVWEHTAPAPARGGKELKRVGAPSS